MSIFFALGLALLSTAADPNVLARRIEATLPAGLVLERVSTRTRAPVDGAGMERIEWKSPPRPGTVSVQVVYAGGAKSWVTVKLAKKEAAIDLSKPPIARGTPIKVTARFGAATVTTEAVLERSARPGEQTTARLKH